MGFLDWFKARPESKDYQIEERKFGPITGYSSNQALASEQLIDRRLTDVCQRKGTSPKGRFDVEAALHQEILGHSRAELKAGLGMDPNGPAGSKAFPESAQEAMTAGKLFAAYDIERSDIAGETKQEIDRQVADAARESGRETRRRLPW